MKISTVFRLLVPMLLLGALAASQGDRSKPKYQDYTASPEDRAADLVSRMTLEEKVGQMLNSAPAIPRLGIPAYDWWNEALHGVARAGLATVFPQAIGLAATWDTNLESRIADAISTEARAKYNDAIKHDNHGRYYGLTFWSPNINIFRDPRWGRGQETFGEDPYLTSRIAIAFIKAMQGSDPHYFKTIATSKHFAVHSGPESSRHEFDVKPSQHDLDETYLYAFKETLTEGGADSVMCAYNALNGASACASKFLLEDKLRKEWGFKGYVVSDCGAVGDIYRGHHEADSMSEASAKAVKNGTDLDCGTEYKSLAEAVKKGYIQEAEINRSVERLFVARFRLGMFDPAERVPFSKIGMDQVQSPAHQKLALEAAEKSLVLLKNEHQTLPLAKTPKRIAVVGPGADDPDVLLGNYNGIPSHVVTPLEGIEQKFGRQARVRFALGSTYVDSSTALIPTNVLTPDNGRKGERGLLAEYFSNDNLSGKPQVSRVEKRGYFIWDMEDPAIVKAVPRRSFSLRWSGSVQVNQTGDYQLGVARVECHSCGRTDSAQLFLDDQVLVNDTQQVRESMRANSASAHLEAGKPYKLRVEYKGTGGGGGLELVWKPPAEAALNDALDVVKESDLAIACIGLNSRLEGEESRIEIPGFSGGDRTTIDLPESQQKLLKAVLDTGKPTIVVLLNGSALALQTAKERAQAILEAWYPGQEGGTAIANVLAGTTNPAGRLPVTFYESVDQLPPFTDYSMKNRTYRYFSGRPLYPFGYGLSYSAFQYSDLSVKPANASGEIEVTATVRNQSARDGDEVAQLYLTQAEDAEPVLRGFERLHLARGERKIVRFAVKEEDAKKRAYVSVGGGQPRREWTGDHYVQAKLR
jgi:beta-glucosidase